jgi:hypothetical protein
MSRGARGQGFAGQVHGGIQIFGAGSRQEWGTGTLAGEVDEPLALFEGECQILSGVGEQRNGRHTGLAQEVDQLEGDAEVDLAVLTPGSQGGCYQASAALHAYP